MDLFHKNGKKEKEGHYKKGYETGRWTYYYPNGKNQKEGNYEVVRYKVPVYSPDYIPRPPQKRKRTGRERRTKAKEVGQWDYWDEDGIWLPSRGLYEKVLAGQMVRYEGRYISTAEAKIWRREAQMSPEDMLCDTLWVVERA